MNKKGLALAIVLILVISAFVYPVQYVEARDFIVNENCGDDDTWEVLITKVDGTPLQNVRLIVSMETDSEIFYTDENGFVSIPSASQIESVSISKGGYNDKKGLTVSCDLPIGYTGKIESSFLQYVDPLYGMQIDYPSNWQIDKSDPNLRVMLISPQESNTDLYLETVAIVAAEVEFDNPAELANSYLSFTSTNMQGFQLLENIQDTIGGYSAQKIVFTGTMQGVTAKVLVYFTVVEGVGYVFVFDAEPKGYPNYLPIFEKMVESVEIESGGVSNITPVVPQIVSGKYVNSDAGLEIEFPKEWTGFAITFPKEIDYSKLELPQEFQTMAEIYSGMTMVMTLPVESDPAEGVDMIMLTMMETSSVNAFSEFISQSVEGAVSQSSGDIQALESQPECDISNQTILEINEMKYLQINAKCQDLTQDMAITMYILMFMTPEYVLSPMYVTTHELDTESDMSIFEDSLNTLKIENTIDISDPNRYSELFGLKVTKEKATIGDISHEVEIVSDSSITNFAFDENKNEISFELHQDKDVTFGSTEVYLNNILNAPFTVTIDDNVDETFMVTEDKTTGQTSISISYIHPIDRITVSGLSKTENSNEKIPDWIRTNADWWVEGNIDDQAFVGGIQFLIKEGIIQIPETAKSTTAGSSQEIPSWIKNNADWWSQGLISDDDFLKGIQFMVESGIIIL